MVDKRPDQPKKNTGLTSDIQNFVRRRADKADKQDVKGSGVKKHMEIQLLISELDNLLSNMSQTDLKVYTAREKLLELQKIIYRMLDIK
jgi:hypothetical protein